jgi:hypothetical protein
MEFPGLDSIYNLALSNQPGAWLNLGVNLILSTIIGGLVLLVILEIVGKEWGENIHPVNSFILVLIINIINLLGVVNVLGFIPYHIFIIPILVWITLVKAFFHEMEFKHAVIVGIAGYLISIFMVPFLVNWMTELIGFSF